MKSCKSYRPFKQVCADGFVVKPLCAGNSGCPTCGHVSTAALPACLDENPSNLPRHLFDDAGRPRLRPQDPRP